MASVSERINARILEYQKRQRKLWLTLEWEIKERDGKIKRSRPTLCNSYVRGMADLIFVSLTEHAGFNIPDKTNTNKAITGTVGAPEVFRALSAAGVLALGITVGTGSGAVAIGNFALTTEIAEGAGAGQLNYSATTTTSPATVGSTRRFTVVRTMTNNSGASITVNEVALFSQPDDSVGADISILVERSLSTQAIANLASATATYTIGVTV